MHRTLHITEKGQQVLREALEAQGEFRLIRGLGLDPDHPPTPEDIEYANAWVAANDSRKKTDS